MWPPETLLGTHKRLPAVASRQALAGLFTRRLRPCVFAQPGLTVVSALLGAEQPACISAQAARMLAMMLGRCTSCSHLDGALALLLELVGGCGLHVYTSVPIC